jgi:DNA-binding Xre family transcriptional regulator
MLYLHIDDLLDFKGIVKKRSFLAENGFSYLMAHRLLEKNKQKINLNHLELLCEILNCTPNDIMVWQPEDKHSKITKQHNLYKLLSKPKLSNVSNKIMQLPADKINKLQSFLDDLENDVSENETT